MSDDISLTLTGEALLRWFEENRAEYSFRWPHDPYKALLAAILLRQTKAEQVDRVFPVFLERYPSPAELAEADLDEMIILISDLGLIHRSRDLISVAEKIVWKHDGEVPSNYDDLVVLPGVGDYVATFTLTVGHGQSHPIMDSITSRVISRLGASPRFVGRKPEFEQEFRRLLGRGFEEALHYAMIDLARYFCLPEAPKCESCPLMVRCAGEGECRKPK